jgi:hypothetical protein
MSLDVHGVFANEVESSGTCSNETLKGSYGYYKFGMLEGPYASVGIYWFDGNGNAKRRGASSFDGAIVKNHAEFQYKVMPDCTGKFLSNDKEFAVLTVLEDGNEVYVIHENGKQTVFSVAKKIHSKR